MAVKFYAVKVGKIPGIYNTWDDCKVQVEGFPGATYKSFKTAAEAADYMGWNLDDYFESVHSYISFEERFTPKKLISYKRGDIVFANFGFNIFI